MPSSAFILDFRSRVQRPYLDDSGPPTLRDVANPIALTASGARMIASGSRDVAVEPRAGPLIELEGVEKRYRTGKLEFEALRGVDLSVASGEFVAVVGPSGSGKTTILNLVTGIDRPSAGRVVVAGTDLGTLSEERLARWRGANVGIVFQFFQLLPTLTALENAELPMDFLRRWAPSERWERARRHLASVGLEQKEHHLPLELSGGEQQRVAIARALACDPKLIVGDEPTGNLDSETGSAMMELLATLNGSGTTVLFVTHDLSLASRAGRVVTIRDGKVVADERS